MDETLGVLTFRKSNILDESYWNVARKLNSVKEMVEFYIYNNEDGINKTQTDLILAIESKYPELVDSLEKYLNDKIHEIDSTSSNVSVLKYLDISFINIPENPTELKKWEINFVEKRGFTFYGIEIENWKPIDLAISA